MGNLPDCLEGDQATADLVGADLHDIDLTGDSNLVSEECREYHIRKPYWRTPIPAPLQSLAMAYNT